MFIPTKKLMLKSTSAKKPTQRAAQMKQRGRMSLGLVLVLAAITAVLGFPGAINSAVSVPPTGAPPTGTLGLPLNITASYQAKEGALTLDNGLTITSPTGNPNLEVNGRINWNGTVLNDWPSGSASATDFVATTPQTPPNQDGWISLNGQAGTISPAALWVNSAPPTIALPTYGVWGVSSPFAVLPGVSSYGVLAVAGADATSNYALYGNGPAVTSWAGYFAGNVTVLAPFDLLVGNGSLTQGPSGTTGEFCINDVCRSTWPTTFDTHWSDLGTSLETADSSRNLAVGGNSSSAQFYIEKIQSTSSVIVTANGTGSSNLLVIQ